MSATQVEGIPVLTLFPGSAAEKAGVRVGDRLLIVNGVLMNDMESYIAARNLSKDRMTLTLQRGNAIHDLEFEFSSGTPVDMQALKAQEAASEEELALDLSTHKFHKAS